MSEVMQIENDQKGLNKSEAVRQAFIALGHNADPIEVQKHAESASGKEIDIRVIYQIKSNMKTGRDTTIKNAAKHATKAPRAPKEPKAFKVTRATHPVKQETVVDDEEVISHTEFSKLCKLVELVKEFGGIKSFMQVINSKIAV